MRHAVVTQEDHLGEGEVDAVSGAVGGEIGGEAIHLAWSKSLHAVGEPAVREHALGSAASADLIPPIKSTGVAIDHAQADQVRIGIGISLDLCRRRVECVVLIIAVGRERDRERHKQAQDD